MMVDSIKPLRDDELARVADTATVMLHQWGWRQLDIDEVAVMANVDPGRLLATVKDAEGLLTLVLENRDVMDIEAVRALRGDEPLEPRAALHNLMAHNVNQPEIVRLYTVLAGEASEPTHPAAPYFERRYAEMVDIMADMVTGHVPDPDATAVQIIAMMDGLQLQWLRDPSRFDLVAQWDKAAEQLLAS